MLCSHMLLLHCCFAAILYRLCRLLVLSPTLIYRYSYVVCGHATCTHGQSLFQCNSISYTCVYAIISVAVFFFVVLTFSVSTVQLVLKWDFGEVKSEK